MYKGSMPEIQKKNSKNLQKQRKIVKYTKYTLKEP